MEKKPYYFRESQLETGRDSFTRTYSCFYILSPERIYLFYLSKDISLNFLGGILGMLIKSLFDHRLNKNKPQDFPILADLPEKIKEMIPGFNKLVVISRESVIRLKFHMGDLIILLKNGRKFKVLLFPSNIRKVRSYLKFTNWI